MLPAAAYRDDRVLAWERSNLFAGAWVCARTVGRARHAGARRRRRRRRRPGRARARRRRRAARLLQRLPPPRPRADAVRRDRRPPLDPVPVPRLAVRARRRAAVDAALRGARRLRPVAARPRHRSRSRSGTAGRWSTSAGRHRRCSASSTVSRTGSRPYEPERLVVGGDPQYVIAANWKLVVENYQECFHCPRIHPELCAVSPAASGENHDGHDGMWVGGWQDLLPHADTMSLTGASGGVTLRGLDDVARRRIDYLGLLPEPARQPAPRLRDDAPARAARRRPHGDRVPVVVRPAAAGTGRFRPVVRRSTSGTSPTARTGRPARQCSGASVRAATGQGRSPPTRTRGRRVHPPDRPRLPRRWMDADRVVPMV